MSDSYSPQTGKFRVLVIEDDPAIARLIMANLSRSNLDCCHAQDGIEGLTLFQQYDPHLVLSDMMMPGLDGREVCARIRESSMVPVIIITAADSPETQLAAFKAGADDYIAKPFDPRVLTSRIIAHLRRVYRYDAAIYALPTAAPDLTQSLVSSADAYRVPWLTCASCGYMGPRPKFLQQNITGQQYFKCPYCQDMEHISFAQFAAE
ncbi:MAG: response regulator transcription factor [Armatimonadota bacterium]|nr:response regulator transcription factor [Armatimonadota bacterium]